MRVALLSHIASPVAPTGAERSLAVLAAGLANRGHEVSLAVPGRWALAEEVRARGIAIDLIPVRACWLVQYHKQPWPRQVARWLRYVAPDPGASRLADWLDRVDPEVVHVNCLPHLRGAAAACRGHRPVVWHVREMLAPGPRRRAFARRLARDADRVVAVSGAVAGWLADEGLGDRLDMVHNGVAVPTPLPDRGRARSQLGLAPEDVVVLQLGQLVAHKGAADLLEAVWSARQRGAPVSALLAGDGPSDFRRRLEARVAIGPDGWGRVLRPVADPWQLLAAADLVAVTTRWPDPLPRSVLEAMASARPVIGFASGGVPEMVEDGVTGRLVEAGDVTGLARAIAELAGDPARREAMGAAGARRAVDEFSVVRHVDRMEKILVTAAGRGFGSQRLAG
jgi:glycosyltransferase involved in cell wall biosynthesis